jgi:AcrR family transcriptional regulator
MALAEGLMMRSFADPSINRESYSELLEIVGGALMLSIGEVAIDGVPPEHHLSGATPPPTRASLIATLLRLFQADRATMPTVDELARAAGCSPNTITSAFGGVVGLLRAAWDEWTPEFEEEAARSTAQGSDPLTTLYRVARSIAVRAAEQQALTRALVMSEIGVDPHSRSQRSDPIADLFERLVRHASELGDLRPPAAHLPHLPVDDATVFAHALRSMLLSIVVNTPLRGTRSAEEHGHWCVDYAFAALLPARRAVEPS